MFTFYSLFIKYTKKGDIYFQLNRRDERLLKICKGGVKYKRLGTTDII